MEWALEPYFMTENKASKSRPHVVPVATALGCDPDDILHRDLDVAGLAVHAADRGSAGARRARPLGLAGGRCDAR